MGCQGAASLRQQGGSVFPFYPSVVAKSAGPVVNFVRYKINQFKSRNALLPFLGAQIHHSFSRAYQWFSVLLLVSQAEMFSVWELALDPSWGVPAALAGPQNAYVRRECWLNLLWFGPELELWWLSCGNQKVREIRLKKKSCILLD